MFPKESLFQVVAASLTSCKASVELEEDSQQWEEIFKKSGWLNQMFSHLKGLLPIDEEGG